MLFADLLRDPDHDASVEPGRIRDELAEVHVVCRLELVLDDQPFAGRGITTKQVSFEGPDGNLRIVHFELDANSLRQLLDVRVQPRREITFFVGPYKPRVYPLDAMEVRCADRWQFACTHVAMLARFGPTGQRTAGLAEGPYATNVGRVLAADQVCHPPPERSMRRLPPFRPGVSGTLSNARGKASAYPIAAHEGRGSAVPRRRFVTHTLADPHGVYQK